MSVITTLVVGAVVLFLFLVVIVVGGMIVGAVYWSKDRTTRERYGLVRHAYDKDGPVGLSAMTSALKELDSDLPRDSLGTETSANHG